MSTNRWLTLTLLLCLGLRTPVNSQAPCPGPTLKPGVVQPSYSMTIGSAAGVAGDVVGVTLAMQPKPDMAIIGYPLLDVVVCHDPTVAELVPMPERPNLTDEFELLVGGGASFLEVNEDTAPPGTQTGHGFILEVFFAPDKFSTRFPAPYPSSPPPEPVPIMTVYYKLKGNPGESTTLEFCDDSLKINHLLCNYNHINSYEWPNDKGEVPTFDYLSENTPGTLSIKPRPATPQRTEVPAYPEAITYKDPPTPEEAGFQVTIKNCSHVPGGLAAADVYVKSNVEYTGIMLPIGFDSQHLEFAWAQHFYFGGLDTTSFPGADPNQSRVYIYSGLKGGIHRLAAPDEEYLAATLYFTLLDGETTRLPNDVSADWRIIVRHDGNPEEISIPQVLVNAEKSFPSPALIPRGDANVDQSLDLSDAVFLLSFLFQGGPRSNCASSQDFNRDGRVDISDAVAILNCLFLGGTCFGDLDQEVPCM